MKTSSSEYDYGPEGALLVFLGGTTVAIIAAVGVGLLFRPDENLVRAVDLWLLMPVFLVIGVFLLNRARARLRVKLLVGPDRIVLHEPLLRRHTDIPLSEIEAVEEKFGLEAGMLSIRSRDKEIRVTGHLVGYRELCKELKELLPEKTKLRC